VRIDIQTRGRIGDPHQRQQVNRPLNTRFFVAALVHLNGFHNLVADGVARVKAGHRVLEDHRHFRAH
jgi:hypothetical protein